jgi:3-oxoacyl-[acyl-carrier-protein] synthase-3
MQIHTFASELGEFSSTVEESAERGWLVSEPRHLREAGFSKHAVCAPETTAYDLARRAVKKIEGELKGIGAVFYHSALPVNSNLGSPEEFKKRGEIRFLTDFPVSRLQAEFGLDDAFVVGISQQACTGILGAIRLANSLLVTEPELGSILCVTSDRVPEGALHESTYNPLADAAIACVVSPAPRGYRILASDALTNGAMSLVTADEVVGSYFSYTHRLIHRTLAKAKMTISDLTYIVPQNTTRAAWQIFCSLLRFDHERVLYPTLPEVGHLVSGCNFLNLMRLEADGVLRTGDRILLPMAGYGLNWQCLLLEKV